MLADFEGGEVEACKLPGRRGGTAFAYFDGTGAIEPGPGKFGKASLLSPPRGTSRYALHFRGKGISDWGAGVAMSLDMGTPVDLANYSGFDIWLRSSELVSVTIGLAVPETLDSSYGGTCRSVGKLPCDDHFGFDRIAQKSWTRYRAYFRELHQAGWGVPARFEPSKIIEVHVKVNAKSPDTPPMHDFDLWVDDIGVF